MFAILGERLFNNVVPVATIVFVVFAAIATVVLNTTRFGRYVFAVGGNERAARLSGVPVSGVKIAVYAITALPRRSPASCMPASSTSAAPMTAPAMS